jgi:hypothetical protein
MHGKRVLPEVAFGHDQAFLVEPVSGGPNDGLWYVSWASFRMNRGSNLNPHVLPSGPKRQLPNGSQANGCRKEMGLASGTPVLVNLYTFNAECQSEDMAAVIRGAWNHEGFGSTGSNGHEAMARAAAALPDNDPHARFEEVVDADEQDLRAILIGRYEEIADRIRIAGQLPDPTGNWSGHLWLWNPAINRYERSNVITF